MRLEGLVSEMRTGGVSYAEAVLAFRRSFLLQLLLSHRGSQAQAARELNVHRNTMSRMLKEVNITRLEVRALRKKPPQSIDSPSHHTADSKLLALYL